MATKTWTINVDGEQHTVHLEHGCFSGKRLITVDGQPVKQIKRNLFDLGGAYPVTIGGHSGFVRISTNGLTFSYDLIVDSVSVTTGKPVAAKTPLPRWHGSSWARASSCPF